jgi:citrate synthase
MVASIDHGAGTPSILATRTAASGGASVKNAATAGFLTMDSSHGAAVEGCMEVLAQAEKTLNSDLLESEMEAAISKFLDEERSSGRKIVPGFGHRQHAHDPRVDKLFGFAEDAHVNGNYILTAKLISKILSERAGKPLPINIDGAMAAILCEIGYPQGLGNALFLIARLSSLLVHAHEEVTTMPRMRKIDPVDFGYSGVEDRELPKGQA